jgi:hypothetical protein
MDWRFLPFIPSGGRALLIYPGEPGAVLGLTANFDPVVVLSAATLSSGLGDKVEVAADKLPFPSETFDLVAFPDGLPEGENSLAAYRPLLNPTGVMVVGFLNRWGYAGQGRKDTRCMSLRQARRMVKNSGCCVKAIYGAIPDHRVPAFLFPLQPRAAHFALKRFLRTKNRWSRIGFPPALTGRLLWAVPAYCMEVAAQ